MAKEITKCEVVEWLKERKRNCQRIAVMKSGDDKQGWLEDAEYFDEAINLIESV